MVTAENNRIARNTLFLYLRTLVTIIIGLYTSRKVLEVLGIVDFGIFNIVGGIIVMLSTLNVTFAAASQRFLSFELGKQDSEGFNRAFNSSLIIQLITAAVLLIAAETVGLWFVNTQLVIPPERLVAANWVYQASVVMMLTATLVAPFQAAITAHEQMHIPAYVDMAGAVARLALIIALAFMPCDKLIGWSIMLMIIPIVSAIYMVIYCVRRFPHCHITLHRDKAQIGAIATFSGWNLYGSIANLLHDQGLNVLLNLFGGPIANAARAVSSQIRNAAISLTLGFQKAVNPQIVKNYAAEQIDTTRQLLYRSSKLGFYLILIPTIPICFECSYLLDLWLVDVPPMAVLFTTLIFIEALFDAFTGPLYNSLLATGNIKRSQLTVNSILLLLIPMSYLLLKLGAPLYVPLILSIVFVVICNSGWLYFCRAQLDVSLRQYLRQVIMPCTIVTAASAIIPLIILFSLPQGVVRFSAMIIASIACTIIIIWYLGLEASERSFTLQFIKSHIKRFQRH